MLTMRSAAGIACSKLVRRRHNVSICEVEHSTKALSNEGFFRGNISNMNAMMDEPEFFKYLFGNLPVEHIKRAYEEYTERKTGQASYDLWLSTLMDRPDMADLMHRIWHIDQAAKQANEVWLINLEITRKVPRDPAKQRTDKITVDEIVEFWKSLQNPIDEP